MSNMHNMSIEQLEDRRFYEYLDMQTAIAKSGKLETERDELVSKVQSYYNILWIFGFFMYVIYGGRIYELEHEIMMESISKEAAWGMITLIERRIRVLQNEVTFAPERLD